MSDRAVSSRAVGDRAVGEEAVSSKAALARERSRPRYDVSSVLETCVAVFNEQGYDGTSMEDLSRRLGISKSSIYHHIESKEAILGLALACGAAQAPTAPPESDHHHELHPPPVGPSVHVTVDGKVADVVRRIPVVAIVMIRRANGHAGQ